MMYMLEHMNSLLKDMLDVTRHANVTAYELYNLSDSELSELGLTRLEIPYVSQTSALKIK